MKNLLSKRNRTDNDQALNYYADQERLSGKTKLTLALGSFALAGAGAESALTGGNKLGYVAAAAGAVAGVVGGKGALQSYETAGYDVGSKLGHQAGKAAVLEEQARRKETNQEVAQLPEPGEE